MDSFDPDRLIKAPVQIPELSYSQELLATPVPIANRIDALSSYVIPSSKVHTLAQIAQKLDITPHRVKAIAQEIGIETEDDSEYPLFTYELLEEELAWEQILDSLDEYVSVKTIAKVLARSERWVSHRANELAIFPEHRMMVSGRRAYAYPNSLIVALRHVMLHTPPAGEWSNLSELEVEIGKDREWILKRLKEGGFEAQARTSHVNHSVVDHYPAEASEYLRQVLITENRPAGTWLTMAYMARQLNRDTKWIQPHLAPYESLKEERLDDVHKLVDHYPPQVFDVIAAINAETLQYDTSDEYMTVKTLAQKIGRSVLWVKNRLDTIEATPETRRNRSNRLYEYYPPEAVDQLRQLDGRG